MARPRSLTVMAGLALPQVIVGILVGSGCWSRCRLFLLESFSRDYRSCWSSSGRSSRSS
jgi:hypothetical protein